LRILIEHKYVNKQSNKRFALFTYVYPIKQPFALCGHWIGLIPALVLMIPFSGVPLYKSLSRAFARHDVIDVPSAPTLFTVLVGTSERTGLCGVAVCDSPR